MQFTNCINEINNIQIDDTQDIDIILPTYNLIEHSAIYWKTLGSLWQYYGDELALYNNNNIIDFHANNDNSTSFKVKKQIIGQRGNGGTKNVQIMVPLKYLINFRRTPEMQLITCEINLPFSLSKKMFLSRLYCRK